MSARDVVRAQAEARDARGQMLDTVDAIKHRLAPRTLAEDIWEEVRDRGSHLAEEAVDLARARPKAAAALGAATVLLLIRHPLRHAASSLFGRSGGNEDDTAPPLDGI